MKKLILSVSLIMSQTLWAGGSSCISDGTCALLESDYQLEVLSGAICSGPGFSVRITELINAYNGQDLNKIYYHADLIDAQLFSDRFGFEATSLYSCQNCEPRFKVFDRSVAVYNNKYAEIESEGWVSRENVMITIRLQDAGGKRMETTLASLDGGQTFSLTNFYRHPITANVYRCQGINLIPKLLEVGKH